MVYHWNRIIVAGILLIALIIAAVVAVNRQLEPATAENSNTVESSEQPALASQPPIETPKVAKEESLQEAAAKNISSETSEQQMPVTQTETKEVPSDIAESTKVDETQITQAKQEKADSIQESVAITTKESPTKTTAPEIKPTQKAKKEKSIATDAPLFSNIETQVYSDKIKSFVLAERVKKKLPIGSIDDIRLDHNKIATVYAHSEADGLKDEILHYVWILNGKKIARVKSGVWGNSWRSYSSKFINPQMKGDWKVELQNNKGEVLAASSFHY